MLAAVVMLTFYPTVYFFTFTVCRMWAWCKGQPAWICHVVPMHRSIMLFWQACWHVCCAEKSLWWGFKATFCFNVMLQLLCRISAVWISCWEPAGHHKLNHRHLVFACSLLNWIATTVVELSAYVCLPGDWACWVLVGCSTDTELVEMPGQPGALVQGTCLGALRSTLQHVLFMAL